MEVKMMLGVLLFSVLMVSVFGASDYGNITSALTNLQIAFCQILPAIIGALILLAAIIFAAGQMVGAETRARANVWATNMLIGAAIGVLVYVLVPWFLGFMFPSLTLTC